MKDEGACGVLCEASDAGSVVEDGLYIVRAIAFSRFRVRGSVDPFAALPVVDIDPVIDAQPEDDDALIGGVELTERRAAVSALEMRCHLLFGNVAQLLAWSGPYVTSSATLGQLAPSARAERFHACRRFAPIAAERFAAVPDECELPIDDAADEAARMPRWNARLEATAWGRRPRGRAQLPCTAVALARLTRRAIERGLAQPRIRYKGEHAGKRPRRRWRNRRR